VISGALGAPGATGAPGAVRGASATGAVRASGAAGAIGAMGAMGSRSAPANRTAPGALGAPGAPDLKDSFLSQVKASKVFLYNTVIAQAYEIDVTPSRITFTFLPNQRVPKRQCEDARAALETIAEKVAGHKIPVSVVVAEAAPQPESSATAAAAPPAAVRPSEDELRREALSDPSVQALFEIFPVEKSKIEEM
jgi:hypothetical protein